LYAAEVANLLYEQDPQHRSVIQKGGPSGGLKRLCTRHPDQIHFNNHTLHKGGYISLVDADSSRADLQNLQLGQDGEQQQEQEKPFVVRELEESGGSSFGNRELIFETMEDRMQKERECRNFRCDFCRLGDKCHPNCKFAHKPDELRLFRQARQKNCSKIVRPLPDKARSWTYPPQKCENLENDNGIEDPIDCCPYLDRCDFPHSTKELRQWTEEWESYGDSGSTWQNSIDSSHSESARPKEAMQTKERLPKFSSTGSLGGVYR
jgi:hypothetical protein